MVEKPGKRVGVSLYPYGPLPGRKLTQINRVGDLRELSIPPGNRLERLAGDREGQHSIRINSQYRICFSWEAGYADDVEITDYH